METSPDWARGWSAALELGYVSRGATSVPALRRHRGPIRVQKHHAHEPGVCQHIIVHPPAGMAGGDVVAIDIAVDVGAHAQLTTPGATPWYRSLGPRARQELHARVAAGATLELLPREHIVYDGAAVELHTTLELADGARAIAWEVVALGRPHGDAPWSSGSLRTSLSVLRDGALLFEDRLVLAADDPLRRSPLGLADTNVLATMIVAARLSGEAGESGELATCRALPTPGRAGLTLLGDDLVVARWLGASVEPARRWLEALWATLRPVALGRPAIPPRIWRT